MTNLLLYQRIAQQLAEDIRRGVYRPGERVPSVRKMSRQLSVSHATVLQAYANANMGHTVDKAGEAVTLSATTRLIRTVAARAKWLTGLIILIGRLIGIRLTRQGILKAIPVASSGVNAALNWRMAADIARQARTEFKQFRDDLRIGKYRDDPDYAGLGN